MVKYQKWQHGINDPDGDGTVQDFPARTAHSLQQSAH